jgi:hypothetical protein
METASFVPRLREIRNTLRGTFNAASEFEMKLVGPRPAEGQNGTLKGGAESVSSLLNEIGDLSLALAKTVAHQHEIVGEFTPVDCEAPKSTRYA